MDTRQTTGGGWGVAGLHRLQPLNAHGGSTAVPNILRQGRAPGAPWAAVPLLRVGWPRRPSVAARQAAGGGWGVVVPHRLQPLHPDRGSSMTSKPVAFLLVDLGIAKTHSRPYTSTDNPYSEAAFKTLKYHPGFPARFLSIEQAREFCREFFGWCNNLCRPRHKSFYADVRIMPTLSRDRVLGAVSGRRGRHNQRASRNARSVSGGR